MTVIDLDLPASWPAALRSLAQRAAQAVRGATRYTADLELPASLCDDIQAQLDGLAIRCYHCTRLLDEETDSLRSHGLRSASDDLIRDKLEVAVTSGALSGEDAMRLAAGNLSQRQRPIREGQISACSTRRTLDEHADGLYPLLAHWGGEIIYFHQTTPDLVGRLRTIGRPRLVVVNLPLRSGQHDLWLPEAAKLIVGRVLLTEDQGGGVHYRLPPDQALAVETVWQPGDPNYDRHSRLPRD